MLRQITVATIFAAAVVMIGPARTADTLPASEGLALTGQDDSENDVTADLHAYVIAVQMKNDCGLPWYVHTGTATAPVLGFNEPLISCKIFFCIRTKLEEQCKNQPKYFSANCNGTWSAEPEGRYRLEVNYDDEYYAGRPVCALKKKKRKKSTVFLLKKPPTGDTSGQILPSKDDLIKCAVHAYLPGDHPLHGAGCK